MLQYDSFYLYFTRNVADSTIFHINLNISSVKQNDSSFSNHLRTDAITAAAVQNRGSGLTNQLIILQHAEALATTSVD